MRAILRTILRARAMLTRCDAESDADESDADPDDADESNDENDAESDAGPDETDDGNDCHWLLAIYVSSYCCTHMYTYVCIYIRLHTAIYLSTTPLGTSNKCLCGRV